MLLVGSPMCTAFSAWQRINNLIRSPVMVAAELKRAKQHLDFCVELHREQGKAGFYFMHEQPAFASSGQKDIIKSMMKDEGVVKATCDQCMYGCADAAGSPVKKPTSFMMNAPQLAKELGDRCNGRHGKCGRPEGCTHAQCRGRTARMAAIYHFKLCSAI